MADFVSPSEFAENFYERILQKNLRDTKTQNIENLPQRSDICTIVSECYQASFLTDEGRSIYTRLLYNNMFDFFEETATMFHKCVRLHTPQKLTSRGIAILSPAADPEGQDLLIEKGMEGLRLIGFARSRRSRDAFSNATLSSELAIDILGPGRIRLVYENYYCLEYREGRVRSFSRFVNLEVFPNSLAKEVHVRLSGMLSGDSLAQSSREGLEMNLDGVQRSCLAWFSLLLLRIRDLRHGGTLLFEDDIRSEDLLIKFPVGETDLIGLFIRDWIESYERHQMLRRDDREYSKFPRCSTDAEGAIVSIVGMSAIDGAVLFSREFSLRGFGTRITVNQKSPIQLVRRCDSAGGERNVTEIPVTEMGMRHQSAIQFVGAAPGRQAFVISTDCSVRYFYNKGGEVLMVEDFDVSTRPYAGS